MIPIGPLRLVEPDSSVDSAAPDAPKRPQPKVFTRTFQVPPGLPWDQARAADLEARHGSPLPLSEVRIRRRRLEPWRLGAAGRYAAIYATAADADLGFEATVDLDGRKLSIAFASPAAAASRMRNGLAIGGATVIAVASVTIGSWTAVVARQAAVDAIGQAEVAALGRARASARARQAEVEARALARLRSAGAPMADVLADLAKVSAAKQPATWVEGFHWDRGLVAVEAFGDSPFGPAHPATKSETAIRPGVHLWTLGDDRSAAKAEAPEQP